MSQFQFGNFENRGGGLYFSKMSQFQLFDSVVCNITFRRNVRNSKMSQFGQRGGQHFSKMSQMLEGGGVNHNWDIVQIFSFFLVTLPLDKSNEHTKPYIEAARCLKRSPSPKWNFAKLSSSWQSSAS